MNNSIGLIESKGIISLVEAADVILKNSPVKIIWIKKLENGLVSMAVSGATDYVKAAVDSAVEAGKKVGDIYSYSIITEPSDELIDLFSDLLDINDIKSDENKSLKITSVMKENKVDYLEKDDKKENVAPLEIVQTKKLVKRIKQKKILKDKPSVINNIEIKKSEDKVDSQVKTDTIERLRKEALGFSAKVSAVNNLEIENGKNNKITVESNDFKIDINSLEKMNVHKLRHYARSFENFAIKGRQISKANRNELIELFRKIKR